MSGVCVACSTRTIITIRFVWWAECRGVGGCCVQNVAGHRMHERLDRHGKQAFPFTTGCVHTPEHTVAILGSTAVLFSLGNTCLG
jgi:hypothetical protein